jgi:Ca2+-transporting ATPase
VVAAKGAPEAVAALCHFTESQRSALAEETDTLAREGLRVLAVARAAADSPVMPEDQHAFDFQFIGLVGLADPLRLPVPEAVRECYSAGIRVVMITGDYPATAQNIARQIGLVPNDRFITGPELDAMSDDDLSERVKTVNIFARVVPEQKLRIVTAMKSNGAVVAMTGDGVNDAPALKAADIGIAMGGRGTDVAREAAALVLLDDDFSSIVHAVRLGRRIFDNLKKAIAYILAVHVPIAGLSLIPVLFKWPLILLPVHVVFLEMIIDPACSIIFEVEPEEKDVMKRQPRDSTEPLLSRSRLILSLMQGLGVLAIVLAVFAVSSQRGQSEDEARTLTFATLVIANVGLILVNRSWSRSIIETLRTPNAAVWWVIGGAISFLTLVIYVPVLQTAFHFAPLHGTDIAIALAAGLISILWFEGVKVFRRQSGV